MKRENSRPFRPLKGKPEPIQNIGPSYREKEPKAETATSFLITKHRMRTAPLPSPEGETRAKYKNTT